MNIQTPDWVKNAVFYQIFPDRFARSQRHIDDPAMAVNLEPWDAPPTLSGYKGGDLWGIAEHLDYLKDLGITALYLTPIFQSACNHRYHTHDYYRVDPLLGGDRTFYDLLEAAHARDVRIVLDGVFNHCSRGFFFFNDILENGPHSPWLDWFKVEDWPVSGYDGSLSANYVGWANNRALPEFNHAHPAVREYIMRVGEYWVRQGIDGWRLDVAYEIEVEGFWQEFRQRIKAINPDAYIVGEVWIEASQWLDGTQFDGVMNYPLTAANMAFTAAERVRMDLVETPSYFPYPALDAIGYGDRVQHLLSLYPWDIQLTQLNLLSSHDVARILSVVQEDEASVVLALLLMMASPGAPCIYYGDEVGLLGELDPDSRRVFPPEEIWNQELLGIHKQLITLRRSHQALCMGDYRILLAQDCTYSFLRQIEADAEAIIVAVNTGPNVSQIALPAEKLDSPKTANLWFSYGEATGSLSESMTLVLTLPPRSGLMLELT